jgi:hypothetical protein
MQVGCAVAGRFVIRTANVATAKTADSLGIKSLEAKSLGISAKLLRPHREVIAASKLAN